MFLYLIAFVATLLTIFGLLSARKSLRDFSNTGYNQLLEHLLPAFRTLFPLPNEEFIVDQDIPADEGRVEQFVKSHVLTEEETDEALDVSNSMDENSDMKKKSTESFTFDYKAGRYDSNSEAEGTMCHVQQDMWNVLRKVPFHNSNRGNVDLYNAFLQESINLSSKVQEDDDHKKNFNKTKIINEATYDKMYEQEDRKVIHEERNGNHHK